MPRSVRGLGDAHPRRRELLKQESYVFKGESSRPPREDSVSDATSLIRTCEAWATEAFRLPADFLHSLAQPGKKRRSVAGAPGGGACRGVARKSTGYERRYWLLRLRLLRYCCYVRQHAFSGARAREAFLFAPGVKPKLGSIIFYRKTCNDQTLVAV